MFQYPKNTHITLPSVEGGLGSLNILRDPPKSIQTRYISKVSDTSKITEWIDGSGDRICEVIKPYARGVNPMVSVSYSNYGTNGGQMRDKSGLVGIEQNPISISNGQSYLPYRVNREGAFRPPIIPPEELLPLSRLPRITTQYQTNPGSKRVTFNKLTKCDVDLKEIRKELMTICAPSKAIFNIETPQNKPYEIKNMIRDKNNVYAKTNKNSKQYKLGINPIPNKGIKDEEHKKYYSVPTKAFKNIQPIPLQGFLGNQSLPIQNRVQGNCSTNLKGQENNKYIHKNIQLSKKLPSTFLKVNPSRSDIDINSTIMSRSYQLPERRNRGCFENNGFKPSNYRNDCGGGTAISEKTIYQIAAEMGDLRNQHFN